MVHTACDSMKCIYVQLLVQKNLKDYDNALVQKAVNIPKRDRILLTEQFDWMSKRRIRFECNDIQSNWAIWLDAITFESNLNVMTFNQIAQLVCTVNSTTIWLQDMQANFSSSAYKYCCL